jgi:hypothetical protein
LSRCSPIIDHFERIWTLNIIQAELFHVPAKSTMIVQQRTPVAKASRMQYRKDLVVGEDQ